MNEDLTRNALSGEWSAASAPEEDDDLVFAPEETDPAPEADGGETGEFGAWKVLIVDDEEQVHTVTKLSLQDVVFEGRGLHFLSAHSAEEAAVAMAEHPDVALILLDVIMEEDDSGLKFVRYVRSELANSLTRVVLRTGQPGHAPEEEIILHYDINDYKTKTELTQQKLFTTVIAALRSYRNLLTLQQEASDRRRAEEDLRHLNESLEGKVRERTNAIRLQKQIIEKKNHSITSSINYASRIQKAMLPQMDAVRRLFPESFVFFKPRDIVSGDFYWVAERMDKVFFAAADCTGHGVPGAFMSMIGMNLLNETVVVKGIRRPDLILRDLHKSVARLLKQDSTENRDGMDIALCVIDRRRGTLEYAGAKSPLVYVQDGECHIIKGDKFPVGGIRGGDDRAYTRHTIRLDRQTTVYMFSDGYQDQFGGPDMRKFMGRNLRELIGKIHAKPLSDQRAAVEETINEWMNGLEQIDDMMVVGLRVPEALSGEEPERQFPA